MGGRTYSGNAENSVGKDFKPVPVPAVLCLVQDQLSGAQRVKCLQRHGRRHGADEALPHGLVGKVVRQLLQAEQNAANGRSKGYRDARRRRRGQHLPLARLVAVDVVEELGEDIGAAAGDVDQRTLLAEPHARRHGEDEAQRLGDERPGAEQTANDETAENRLDFRDAAVLGVERVFLY